MNLLKRTYAKLIDKLTIEEAPMVYNGVVGFNNNASLCIESGYKPVNFTDTKVGVWKTYTETNNEIQEVNFVYDSDTYKSRVTELIRAKYSADDEAAILRKGISGIDLSGFQAYQDFCESCKKVAKTEQIH